MKTIILAMMAFGLAACAGTDALNTAGLCPPAGTHVAEVEQRGCCSYNGGVCGCSGGRTMCCNGRLSPSCRC